MDVPYLVTRVFVHFCRNIFVPVSGRFQFPRVMWQASHVTLFQWIIIIQGAFFWKMSCHVQWYIIVVNSGCKHMRERCWLRWRSWKNPRSMFQWWLSLAFDGSCQAFFRAVFLEVSLTLGAALEEGFFHFCFWGQTSLYWKKTNPDMMNIDLDSLFIFKTRVHPYTKV